MAEFKKNVRRYAEITESEARFMQDLGFWIFAWPYDGGEEVRYTLALVDAHPNHNMKPSEHEKEVFDHIEYIPYGDVRGGAKIELA